MVTTLMLAVLVAQSPAAPAPDAQAPKQEEPAKLTPAPKAAEAPKAVEATEEPKKGTGMRAASYAFIGVSLVTAAVGVYFGASASSSASSIMMDQMNGGFTQQQLYDRDQARIVSAKVANGLFIAAAVIAALGIVLFTLSS
jgi:hypothetical protein